MEFSYSVFQCFHTAFHTANFNFQHNNKNKRRPFKFLLSFLLVVKAFLTRSKIDEKLSQERGPKKNLTAFSLQFSALNHAFIVSHNPNQIHRRCDISIKITRLYMLSKNHGISLCTHFKMLKKL